MTKPKTVWKENHHLVARGARDFVKRILASDYTLVSAPIGATRGQAAA